MTLPRTFDPLLVKRRWVIWKIDADGRKPPLSPFTGRNCSSTDPSDWGTYEEAVSGAKKYRCDGVGLVLGRLNDKDQLCGIDLDGCLNGNAEVQDEVVREVLRRFDTYTEVSPSGHGLHLLMILAVADVMAIKQKYGIGHRKPFARRQGGEMALDFSNRYYTVTGDVLESRSEIMKVTL